MGLVRLFCPCLEYFRAWLFSRFCTLCFDCFMSFPHIHVYQTVKRTLLIAWMPKKPVHALCKCFMECTFRADNLFVDFSVCSSLNNTVLSCASFLLDHLCAESSDVSAVSATSMTAFTTLRDVLEDPPILSLFMEHLKREFSVENILFFQVRPSHVSSVWESTGLVLGR